MAVIGFGPGEPSRRRALAPRWSNLSFLTVARPRVARIVRSKITLRDPTCPEARQFVLAVTVFALLVGGCDLSGERMQRGRVLDQDTGEPIAGAIVVGRYMGGISWGGSSCNRAESAVSDAQGWFELPVDRKDGTPLMEAYKRGYDRGNPTQACIPGRIAWTREWRVSVQKWNDSQHAAEIVRVEPEVYRTEAAA